MFRHLSRLATILALAATALTATAHPSSVAAAEAASGYWMLGADGSVFAFGGAGHLGNAGKSAVDIEPTPTGAGYWILDERGRMSAEGDATHLGDAPALPAGERAASFSVTPSGGGYWIFTSLGRVFAFGDATHRGDMTGVTLNGPVLDSVATPSGAGYWMVASDGGIFSFGDARFAGSMGGSPLNQPVLSMAPDPDGAGYWLVASDGGIFAFGDVAFHGSLGANPPATPIVAVALLPGPHPGDPGEPGPGGSDPIPGEPPAPVRIGHVGTYSGALARPTSSSPCPSGACPLAAGREAIGAWSSTVNQAGGIGGHPVELVVGDDAGDPTRHLQLVQAMAAYGVIAFVGNDTTAAGPVALPFLEAQGIPVVGGDLTSFSWDTRPVLFGQGAGVAARIDGLNAYAANLGAVRLGVLYCETDECAAHADYQNSGAADDAGLEIAYTAEVSRVQPDYMSECTNARSAGADALFTAGGRGLGPRIRQSCAQVGYLPVVLTMDDLPSGAAVDGVVMALPTLPWTSSAPAMAAHAGAVEQFFPSYRTTPWSAQAWTAAKLLELVLHRAPTLTSDGIVTALRTVDHETLGGLAPPLRFPAAGPSPTPCFFPITAEDGNWTAPSGDAPIC